MVGGHACIGGLDGIEETNATLPEVARLLILWWGGSASLLSSIGLGSVVELGSLLIALRLAFFAGLLLLR